jgi:RHS repeat-associated protein
LGYWQEPDLSLNYVRARWLDPQTGSWLSVDSVPTEPRYRYVSNMPTMRVDPSGMDDLFADAAQMDAAQSIMTPRIRTDV